MDYKKKLFTDSIFFLSLVESTWIQLLKDEFINLIFTQKKKKQNFLLIINTFKFQLASETDIMGRDYSPSANSQYSLHGRHACKACE